jgi:hypothetical protein
MKPIRTMVTFALACGLQLGMGSTWAQDGLVTGSSGAVTYASGGVGAEQREALAAMRADFNLRLTFATRGSGEMRADVALTITDRKRNPVLTLDAAGPQVYVKLPPGTYWVNAKADEQEQSRSVTIGRNGGAREVYFYWGAKPDQATAQ